MNETLKHLTQITPDSSGLFHASRNMNPFRKLSLSPSLVRLTLVASLLASGVTIALNKDSFGVWLQDTLAAESTEPMRRTLMDPSQRRVGQVYSEHVRIEGHTTVFDFSTGRMRTIDGIVVRKGVRGRDVAQLSLGEAFGVVTQDGLAAVFCRDMVGLEPRKPGGSLPSGEDVCVYESRFSK